MLKSQFVKVFQTKQMGLDFGGEVSSTGRIFAAFQRLEVSNSRRLIWLVDDQRTRIKTQLHVLGDGQII